MADISPHEISFLYGTQFLAWCTILGAILSIIGMIVSIFTYKKAKSSEVASKQAVEEAQNLNMRFSNYDFAAKMEAMLEIIEHIRDVNRSGNIKNANYMYASLRSSLVNFKNYCKPLLEEEIETIRLFICYIQSIEVDICESDDSNFDIRDINKQLIEYGDVMKGIVASVKTRTSR